MFQWLAKRAWDKRSGMRVPGGLESAAGAFLLRKDARYRATVTLTGFETWASNGTVEEKFRELGFKDPKVTGGGSVRKGEAIWPAEDKSVPLPLDPHLSEVVEVIMTAAGPPSAAP